MGIKRGANKSTRQSQNAMRQGEQGCALHVALTHSARLDTPASNTMQVAKTSANARPTVHSNGIIATIQIYKHRAPNYSITSVPRQRLHARTTWGARRHNTPKHGICFSCPNTTRARRRAKPNHTIACQFTQHKLKKSWTPTTTHTETTKGIPHPEEQRTRAW